jgi:hypothetical protein
VVADGSAGPLACSRACVFCLRAAHAANRRAGTGFRSILAVAIRMRRTRAHGAGGMAGAAQTRARPASRAVRLPPECAAR